MWEKKVLKTLTEKNCGVEGAGEIPSLTGEIVGETHRVLEHTQIHLPRNQHQKSPICLWIVGEITEIWARTKQAALFPLGPHPRHAMPQRSNTGCLALANT